MWLTDKTLFFNSSQYVKVADKSKAITILATLLPKKY